MMREFRHHDAYNGDMRTTVNLDDDVASEVAKLRRERGLGLSEAVNELVRAGLRSPGTDYRYKHPTRKMGALVDLTNVADVLELLDEADRAEVADRAS
jgi:Arc/MetJ family transcription regulator